MALPVSDTIRLFLMLGGHQASNRDKQLAYTSSIILIIATTITIFLPYLIFVTGATGGARVNFFLPGVKFYRFNAKNWQFTV